MTADEQEAAIARICGHPPEAPIPLYCTDLSDLQEAERQCIINDPDLFHKWCHYLFHIVIAANGTGKNPPMLLRAIALADTEQRAEAFLLTMEGWTTVAKPIPSPYTKFRWNFPPQ